MSAVCGIGKPSGRRKSAVTANQSASPPTMPASAIARIQPPDYIMKKILDPKGAGVVAGYPPGVMPQTFGQTLTAKEYTDLVAFLLTLK